MRSRVDPRSGRVLWWLCGLVLLAVVGLIVYQLYIRRVRFRADDELLGRLQDQKITADERPLDGKTWPQWRGPRRDGITVAPDLLTAWPEGGPKELWRVPGGDGYSSFAVSDDTAYSLLGTAGGKEAVVAWNLESGKERWRREYEPSASFQYGGPRSTPTLASGRLFVISSAGNLMCLETKDGSIAWMRDLVGEMGGRTPRWGYAESPLVEDGLVYVTPGGDDGRALAAFDAATGKLAWSIEDDLPGYSSPLAITSAGVRQIVFFTAKRLVGVSAKDSGLLWSFTWDTPFDVNATTPVFVRGKEGEKEDDYLFITSGYGKGCALVKLTLADGKWSAKAVYESNELCCHFSTPVLHGEHLYGLDETRDLTCLVVRSGKAAWRKKGRPGFQKGALIRVEDRLLLLGEQGHLALAACDPAGYRESARCRPFTGRCWTLPVLANGRLLLRDQKEVVCLDVRKR